MRPVPHPERIIDKEEGARLIMRTNLLPEMPGLGEWVSARLWRRASQQVSGDVPGWFL
jgi:hypothetical protein